MSARRRTPEIIQTNDSGQLALTVRPRDQSGYLPPLSVVVPLSGWSPSTVLAAAVAYADAHALDVGLSRRRTIGAAYRALLAELPEVRRAEVVERLRGVERFRDAVKSES